MNHLLIFICLYLVVIPVTSCTPEMCPDPPMTGRPCEKDSVITKLLPIWKVSNWPDTSEQIMFKPIFYKNYVITGGSYSFPIPRLKMREKITGNVIWENNDDQLSGLSNNLDYFLKEDKLFIITENGSFIPAIMVINLENGKIEYSKIDRKIFNHNISFGNSIYYKKIYGDPPFEDSTQVWNFDMETYESKYVFTIQQIRDYHSDAVAMCCYKLANGDEVLFYQQRMINSNLKSRVDSKAYNLTQKKFIWSHDSVDYLRNGSVWPSVFKDGRVYFKAAAMLYCYNAETGAILWQQDVAGRVGGDMLLGNMLVEEGRVIVHSNRGFVCSFDEVTGAYQWTARDWADTIKGLVYYKGKVYAASGSDGLMHSLDIKTGQKYWNELTPNKNCYPDASFSTSYPNIDTTSGILIIEDAYFTMAIDLNK